MRNYVILSFLVIAGISCAILVNNVDARVNSLSEPAGAPTSRKSEDSSVLHEKQLVQNLQEERHRLRTEPTKRNKRWALPADVQDIPCQDGYLRRPDGKCQELEKPDDYYDDDAKD